MDEHIDPQDLNLPGAEDDAAPESGAPRRAASAQFIVDSDVGAEAAMREAMDPANQSLADALRLSYRVLQFVIAALILVFLFSGFQSVEDQQTGVMLRWGRILDVDGDDSLAPGLHFSAWPYPAGQFILFEESGTVDLGNAFFPELPVSKNALDDAASKAGTNDPLRPGRNGALLTRDGDLVHLKLNARYDIVDAADYVRALPVQQTQRLITRALERAAVRVVATLGLDEVVDLSTESRDRIRDEAQDVLTRLDSGIVLSEIIVPQVTPPLAIRRAQSDLQNARVEAAATVAEAKTRAQSELVQTAGEEYSRLLPMIDEYAVAIELGDPNAGAILESINAALAAPDLVGDVATEIQRARAYQSQVEGTLGQEARRVASMRDAFRENPEILIRTLWLNSYSKVMGAADAEHFLVPALMNRFVIQIRGDGDVRELRRKNAIAQKDRDMYKGFGIRTGALIPRAEQINFDGKNRRLNVEDNKVVGPRGGK